MHESTPSALQKGASEDHRMAPPDNSGVDRPQQMVRRAKRTAFSLMEVLLATAILLGSILVLMELAGIGRHYIQSVRQRTTAQVLCQTKLSEIVAGLAPVEEVQQRVMQRDPDWVYSVEILPVRGIELAAVRVTVTEREDELQEQTARGKPKQCTLVRWIPSPHLDTVREQSPEDDLFQDGASAEPAD